MNFRFLIRFDEHPGVHNLDPENVESILGEDFAEIDFEDEEEEADTDALVSKPLFSAGQKVQTQGMEQEDFHTLGYCRSRL